MKTLTEVKVIHQSIILVQGTVANQESTESYEANFNFQIMENKELASEFACEILKKGDPSKKIQKKKVEEAKESEAKDKQAAGDQQVEVSSDECMIQQDVEMADQHKLLGSSTNNNTDLVEVHTANTDPEKEDKTKESPVKR